MIFVGVKRAVIFLMAAIAMFSINYAATGAEEYIPSQENLKAREGFQDAKFGIFIHWGVYSQLAGGGHQGIAEWIMENRQIPIKQYEVLAELFYPHRFNADEWVKAFKSAGAKYITITSKHHDGFAMFDSSISDFDIIDKTAFKRDILKELKEACDKHDIKLFFYYSQLDWHHSDYFPRGRTGGRHTGRPEKGNWDSYIDYQNSQLTELLTNYGDIAGFWFDGWWDQKDGAYRDRWRLKETYDLIHKLQPHALIINNHHVKPFPGEDIQPFEQDLPGENTAGFNTVYVAKDMPIETAITMNGSWGYNIVDTDFKSTKELIQTMVKAAGSNSNFLLNTGPMPDGRLQPENLETYKEIGAWLRQYGESIYGTRGGPISARPWGTTTAKGNAVYVHVLNWQDSLLNIPLSGKDIERATLLRTGKPIRFKTTDKGTSLYIPQQELSEWDAIIKIETK